VKQCPRGWECGRLCNLRSLFQFDQLDRSLLSDDGETSDATTRQIDGGAGALAIGIAKPPVITVTATFVKPGHASSRWALDQFSVSEHSQTNCPLSPDHQARSAVSSRGHSNEFRSQRVPAGGAGPRLTAFRRSCSRGGSVLKGAEPGLTTPAPSP
jgi:hypothetical protein